jgi:hypothetical protein
MREASAEKDTHTRTTAETSATDKAATVAAQGAPVAPEKAPSKKAASEKKGATQAKKSAKGANANPPRPKKAARRPGKKASKPAHKSAGRLPRAREDPVEMIALAKGAMLAEIGSNKHVVKIESAKNEAGERVYKIAKYSAVRSPPPLVHSRRLFSFRDRPNVSER